MAQTEADAAQDDDARRAALDYVQMMRLAAWRRGGQLPGLVPVELPAACMPAYMSDQPPGARGRRTGRRRGRPALHPSDRLVNFTVRVPPNVQAKLKRLCRGWLVEQVMAAQQTA